MRIFTEEAIKMAAVSSFDESAWTSSKSKSGVAELSNQVSWLYAVHRKRAGAISGLPVELRKGKEEVKKADWPIAMDMPDLLYRYSLSTDLYGENYMFQVKRGQTVERVRWFDPNTITIEENNTAGLVGFTRRVGGGPDTYPVVDGLSDVMWTWLPGMTEIGPGTPPANVVEGAATVLRYMGMTVEGLFENGAIDSWVYFAPKLVGLSDDDKKQYMGYLKRLLKRGIKKIGEIWTLDPDGRLESMNAPIDQWALPELNDMKAEEICVAHDTPLMLLRPNEGADKAMMKETKLSWVNEVIIPAAQRMLDTLNEQLFEAMGYEWVINAESMNVNQEEEVLKQQAYSGYVASGMPPETAAAMLGLDVPEGMPLVEDVLEPEPQPVIEEVAIEPEIKSVLWHDDEKRFRAWYKKRGSDVDINGFNSNELSYLDKLDVIAGVNEDADIHDWRNYP